MAIQTTFGKAFEYVCLNSLYINLSEYQEIEIEETSAFNIAKSFYSEITNERKDDMKLAANAAVRVIMKLEPQLHNPQNNKPLYLALQEDKAGIKGDVRDVICLRKQNEWEVGLSCKHNHTAVKHSRLSQSIDFGKQWFDIPCSQKYFNTINPLFEELKELRSTKTLWRDLENKEERFYIPLLQAFIDELKNLNNDDSNEIPKRLLHYLLGSNDFYKVITLDNKRATQIEAFNIYGTLNRNAGKVRPVTKIQQLKMPNKFYDISFKPDSQNTIQITCDNGWGISLRIHNARSMVEPSLKFDAELIGIPPSLYTNYELW